MIYISIVEDNDEDYLNLKDSLDRYVKESSFDYCLTRYLSGQDFLDHYPEGQNNIIFMDIEMPGINGVETSRLIRKRDDKAVLIFVTNLAQYAIQGYEVEALDFVLKPVTYPTFRMKLSRALKIALREQEYVFKLEDGGQTSFLNSSDIYYVETYGHLLIFHTKKGEIRTYMAMRTLEHIIKENNIHNLARCNTSFVVNLKYVTKISGLDVYINNDKLTISRPRRKEFLAQLNLFMMNGGK